MYVDKCQDEFQRFIYQCSWPIPGLYSSKNYTDFRMFIQLFLVILGVKIKDWYIWQCCQDIRNYWYWIVSFPLSLLIWLSLVVWRSYFPLSMIIYDCFHIHHRACSYFNTISRPLCFFIGSNIIFIRCCHICLTYDTAMCIVQVTKPLTLMKSIIFGICWTIIDGFHLL